MASVAHAVKPMRIRSDKTAASQPAGLRSQGRAVPEEDDVTPGSRAYLESMFL